MTLLETVNATGYELDDRLDKVFPIEDEKHYSKVYWNAIEEVRIKNLDLLNAVSKLKEF